MQDTRTRNNVIRAQLWDANRSSMKSCYPTGSAKSITSWRGGKFTPNLWRYQTVKIFTASNECKSQNVAGLNGMIIPALLDAVAYDNGTWWYTTPMGKAPQNLVDFARIKAANRRNDPQFGGGVFLAELKQTLMMLFSPIRGARKFLQKAFTKAVKFKDPVRKAKYLSDYWLQMRYGWIPLASDISALSEMIFLGLQKRENVFYTTHGSMGYSSGRVKKTQINVCKSYFMSLYADVYETYNMSVRSTHGWRRSMGFESEELWANLGLSYRDIPGIAWELVPFSFAVDWFYNVGDFISYIRPTPGLTKVGEGFSTKIDYTYEIVPYRESRIPKASSCTYGTAFWPNPMTITQTSYVRDLPVSPVMGPVLDLRYRSLKHIVDALTLSIQKLKR